MPKNVLFVSLWTAADWSPPGPPGWSPPGPPGWSPRGPPGWSSLGPPRTLGHSPGKWPQTGPSDLDWPRWPRPLLGGMVAGFILLAFLWGGIIWRVAPGPSPNGLEPCLATDWACSGRWEHGQAKCSLVVGLWEPDQLLWWPLGPWPLRGQTIPWRVGGLGSNGLAAWGAMVVATQLPLGGGAFTAMASGGGWWAWSPALGAGAVWLAMPGPARVASLAGGVLFGAALGEAMVAALESAKKEELAKKGRLGKKAARFAALQLKVQDCRKIF